ncbi:hypothetical protein GCM10028803_32790 [Larkinella knui]|uniref:Uncharacterized protein n=1 Tax=Larkinella knui TaxID=2025310 RepID=A0A3P1CYA9_9BACT|nr:hypothetical protein [Larkinella knui]RRB18293.1 hypothetical protein EHT87_08475 [Larkinella knui]
MLTYAVAAFASRHPKVAAGVIILSECCNVAIGLLLGSSLLADQPGWYLSFLLAGLVLFRVLFRHYIAIRLPDLVSTRRFRFQKNSYSLLFLINFLAFIVAGGMSGRAVLHPEPSGSVTSEGFRSDGATSEKDSLTTSQPLSQTAVSSSAEDSHTGTKIGYFLLFLASFFLFGLSSRLACNLICAEQGLLGVMVLLLGTGILAGGFYFLGRAFTKNMKPYKEMNPNERKREGRRFRRTLLGTVLGLLVFSLLPALF